MKLSVETMTIKFSGKGISDVKEKIFAGHVFEAIEENKFIKL